MSCLLDVNISNCAGCIFNEWVVEKSCENKISLLFKIADFGLTPARYILDGKRWVFAEVEGKYYFNREEQQKFITTKDRGSKQLFLAVGAGLLALPSLLFAVVKLIAIFSKTVQLSHPLNPEKPFSENRTVPTIYADALHLLGVSEDTDLVEIRNKYVSLLRELHHSQNKQAASGFVRASLEIVIQNVHQAYFTIMTQHSVIPKIASLEEISTPARSEGPSEID